MSMFTQIILAAVLAAIFGFWAKIAVKAWENGSGKVKFSLIAASVILFLVIVGVADYNGWIVLPKLPQMDDDTKFFFMMFAVSTPLFLAKKFASTSEIAKRLRKFVIARIFGGVIELILSGSTVFSMWGLIAPLYYTFEWRWPYNYRYEHIFMYCIVAFALSVVLAFIEAFLSKAHMKSIGILSASNALICGFLIYVELYSFRFTLSLLSFCILMVIQYELFSLLTERRLQPPLDALFWVLTGFIELFFDEDFRI